MKNLLREGSHEGAQTRNGGWQRRPKQLCNLVVFRYPWPLTFVSFIVPHLSVRNYGRRGGKSIDIISFLRCHFGDSFERSNTLLF